MARVFPNKYHYGDDGAVINIPQCHHQCGGVTVDYDYTPSLLAAHAGDQSCQPNNPP